MTSVERESKLLPVRIPMTRGLIGWRLGLVRADHKDLMRGVRQLGDLKKFSSGRATTGRTCKSCVTAG